MKRRRSATLFSFAFLDVFACALGTLIFILVACALRGQAATRTAADDMRAQIEALKAEVAELEEEAARAAAERDAHGWERDALAQKVDLLRGQLADAKAALEEATALEHTADAEARTKDWAWVRLPGRVGDRVPVYVECTGDHVVQQPRGLRESSGELSAAGSKTRALLAQVAKTPSRYLVVVLRSSGYQAYQRLQFLCVRAGVEFAREPLPDSVHVEGWR